jgi:hypothetical protein
MNIDIRNNIKIQIFKIQNNDSKLVTATVFVSVFHVPRFRASNLATYFLILVSSSHRST